MIGKIVNNQIVTPPVNDGNKLNVNLDADWLEANGFTELTEAEIETAVEATEQVRKLAREVFTKLEIREAFKALDKESDLDSLLTSDVEFQKYWYDATEIDLGHPVTNAALIALSSDEEARIALISALKLKIP